jgi:hypothetical protein
MNLSQAPKSHAAAIILVLFSSAAVARAQATATQDQTDIESQHTQTVERGLEFLRTHGQAEDGTFSIKAPDRA